MKKNVLVLFFLLLLPAISFAQPSIHFNEMSHDFGTVSQEDAVRQVFSFTNTGDQELIVQKVSPS